MSWESMPASRSQRAATRAASASCPGGLDVSTAMSSASSVRSSPGFSAARPRPGSNPKTSSRSMERMGTVYVSPC